MEEILALQRKLQEVQTSKPRKLLSERNAIEILEFLRREHSLDILCTLDGKDFLTPAALDQQIYDATLLTKKARLAEVASLLNVGVDWIESRIESLTRKFGLIHINSQLLTREFIELLFGDIEETLRTQKVCSLVDVALRNEIDLAFLKSLVGDAQYRHLLVTPHRLDARANLLISEQFYALLDRKLRGVLNGLTTPVKLDDVSELLQIEKPVLLERLAEQGATVESEMVFSRRFIANRSRNIEKLFLKNGILDFGYLKRQFYIAKPKEFLVRLLKDGGGNRAVFLSKSVLNQTELIKIFIGCEQNLKAYGYANIEDLVNFSLENEDVPALLDLLHHELDPKGLDFESENLLIVCKKDLRKYATLLEREVAEKRFDPKKATPKTVGDLLMAQELVEYQADESLRNFLAYKTLEVADLKRAAQAPPPSSKLRSRRLIKHQVDVMKFKINELIDRSSFIFKYYLLMEKSLRPLLEDLAPEKARPLLADLRRLKTVVLQNIVFLILRKFSHQFKEEFMTAFESFTALDELFLPLFQTNEAFFGFFSALPKDIREVLIGGLGKAEGQRLTDGEVSAAEFAALDFDLAGLLNSKGSLLTIGNFDTNKNKKAEKTFVAEAERVFKTYVKEHLTAVDPEQLFVFCVDILTLKEGLALISLPDYATGMDAITVLTRAEDSRYVELAEQLIELNERFRQALETREDTETFFEEFAETHLD